LDEDFEIKINNLICHLAFFYKGAASFEWLEKQSYPRLLEINKETKKINKAIKSANGIQY
jgi:hypothetical protein